MRRLCIFLLSLSLLLTLTACELKEPPADLSAPEASSDEVLCGTYRTTEQEEDPGFAAELRLEADGTFTLMYNLARDYLPTGPWEFKDGKLYCDCTASDESFVFERQDARNYKLLSDESTFVDFSSETAYDLSDDPVFTLVPSFLPADGNVADISEFNRFLLTVCDRLKQEDPALMGDADKMSLCVDGADFSDADRAQFAAIVQKNMDLEVLYQDYEALKDEGYLADDSTYWKDGFIVTINVKKDKGDVIRFDAEIWRSGDGALYTMDNTAKFDGTRWTIELGDIAAS